MIFIRFNVNIFAIPSIVSVTAPFMLLNISSNESAILLLIPAKSGTLNISNVGIPRLTVKIPNKSFTLSPIHLIMSEVFKDIPACLLTVAKFEGINCSVIFPLASFTTFPAESVTCCTKFFDVSVSVSSMLFCTFVITDGSLPVFCIFAGILFFNAANLSVGFVIVDIVPVAELVRPEKNPVAPPTILLPAFLKDVKKFLPKPVIPLNSDLPIFVMTFTCGKGNI